MEKKFVLEESTHTHVIEGTTVEVVKDFGDGTLQLKIKGNGIVTHGEHGTVITESPNVVKYNQQELNPVTQALQRVFD